MSVLLVTKSRGAANPGCSRLSGGSAPGRTRPPKTFWRGGQTSFNRILLNVGLNTIEFRIGTDQMIVAFILPEWRMTGNEKIRVMSRESLKRPQPFGGNHVRRDQKMNMVWHNDVCVKVIPVQFLCAVPQCRHYHLGNLLPLQKQGPSSACVQEPVEGNERLTGRDKPGRREYAVCRKTPMQSEGDKQRLLDYVPVGQPALVMAHLLSLCANEGEVLRKIHSTPPERRLQPGLAAPHSWMDR
jgi:hypothetical protein